MHYLSALDKIIDDGIAAARRDYARDELKCSGAVAGFEACRGLQPKALTELLVAARTRVQQAFIESAPQYWGIRTYEAEIEWTCNVVSAILQNEGLPIIVAPTARGTLKAAEILQAQVAAEVDPS